VPRWRLTGAATAHDLPRPQEQPVGKGTYQTLGNADVVIRADRDTTAPPHRATNAAPRAAPHGRCARRAASGPQAAVSRRSFANGSRELRAVPALRCRHCCLALMPDFSGRLTPKHRRLTVARTRGKTVPVARLWSVKPARRPRRTVRTWTLNGGPACAQATPRRIANNVRKALRGFGQGRGSRGARGVGSAGPPARERTTQGQRAPVFPDGGGRARLKSWSGLLRR